MPVEEVAKAFIHAKKVIKKHGSPGVLHEAATRYYIIDPILQALGWELKNPQHVLFESRRTIRGQERATDYVLCKGTKRLAVIEAKGWSRTKLRGFTEENQLKGWAQGSRANLAVLTNGQFWYFYNLGSKSPFGDKRVPDVDICDQAFRAAADTLHWQLNKRRLWNST